MHIVIPHTLRNRLRLYAQQEQKSQAEVVRELLQKGLDADTPGSTWDAPLRLAELGERLKVHGPKDWAAHHDAYFAKPKR